jgi:trimeric autotransporter adhesin
MDQRLNGHYNTLAYMGSNAVQPPNLTERAFDPTSNDSKNFFLGDFWLNTEDQGLWVLVNLSGNVADWREIATGSISTFSTFHTDNGDATVVANAITFNAVSQAGGTVTFSGAGSTVRLNVTTSSNNTTVGGSSGNTTLTGSNNTGFGFNTLNSLTTGSTNTAMGVNAGSRITTAIQNTLFGSNAGAALTTGNQNTLLGRGAGILMTTATNNIGVGSLSLGLMTTGTNNTCMGQGAGLNYSTSESNNIVIGAFNNGLLTESGVTRVGSYSGTSNNFNTFIGFQSGNQTYTIGSATSNTAVGYQTLRNVTTGSNNTCLGKSAGNALTTTSENIIIGNDPGSVADVGIIRIVNQNTQLLFNHIFIGSQAGNDSYGTATECIGIGYNALKSITTNAAHNVVVGHLAMDAATSARGCVAIGQEALGSVTTGDSCVAIGYTALNALTTGVDCTAVGNAALDVCTGSSNTAVGNDALGGLLTGTSNIALGDAAGSAYVGAESSNIVIGSTGVAAESNTIRIGTSGGGSAQQNKCFIAGINGITTGGVAIPVLIDGNDQLGTVSSSIRYKDNVEDMADDSSAIMQMRPVSFVFKKDKTNRKQYGLIAEEVEHQMPDIVVYDAKTGQPETVQYHILPVLLLNELKKLQARVKDLEDQLAGS